MISKIATIQMCSSASVDQNLLDAQYFIFEAARFYFSLTS